MHSLLEQILQERSEMNEALIVLGKKAYPKYGHIVIMAGGGGSGKGFIIKNLLGVEGKIFDVDELKTLASKSEKIRTRVKKEFGVDLEQVSSNLKDPKNTAALHQIIGKELNLPDKREEAFFKDVMTRDVDRKPNIIFDMTLKNTLSLNYVVDNAVALGYDKKSIHIVWVVNDVEVALEQNKSRDRTVPYDIIVTAHNDVAQTIKGLIQSGGKLRNIVDGDIVFAFNKVGIDSEVIDSTNLQADNKLGPQRKDGKTSKAKYVEKAKYVYIKRSGKRPLKWDQIEDNILNKIRSYIPKGTEF